MARDIEKRKQEIWREFEKKCDIRIPEGARVATEMRVKDVYDSEGLEVLKGFLEDAAPLLKAVIANSPNRQPKNDTASPKARYRKPFERRLYLVGFVTERRQGKRIDWQRVSTEWNKERPEEPMTPTVFNAEYHRAKADPYVQREYIKRKHPQTVKELASLAKGSPLAFEVICQAAGSTAFYQGEEVMANTVSFMKILESSHSLSLAGAARVDTGKAI